MLRFNIKDCVEMNRGETVATTNSVEKRVRVLLTILRLGKDRHLD